MGQAKRRGTFEERKAKAPKMSMLEREIYNSAPSMIHENKFEVLNCYLCDKEMTTVHDTHNAFPLAKLQSAKEAYESDVSYRCCSECNKEVTKARFDSLGVDPAHIKTVTLGELVTNPKYKSAISCGFEAPVFQKKFAELGQNFYETGLGQSILKRKRAN